MYSIKKAVKNTKSDLLNANVNNLEMITTNLVLINQNNTMWHVDKEISDVNDLVTNTLWCWERNTRQELFNNYYYS